MNEAEVAVVNGYLRLSGNLRQLADELDAEKLETLKTLLATTYLPPEEMQAAMNAWLRALMLRIVAVAEVSFGIRHH